MSTLVFLLFPLTFFSANEDSPFRSFGAWKAHSERPAACDLEITVRPHRKDVVFGDPLYLEVTFVNRAEEAVSGLPPDLELKTFWFNVARLDGELSYSTRHELGGGMQGGNLIVFEPGKEMKYYFRLFLPVFHRYNHPFWKSFRQGGHVVLSGVYPLGSGATLATAGFTVIVDARDEDEIAALGYWSKKEVAREDYEKGPTPANFYVPMHVANRKELAEAAVHTSLDGELGDLVALSLKFRDLYESPPEAREGGNGVLVEWLRKQPDVKSEVLARAVHNLAGSYNMWSTARAIEKGFPDIKPFTGFERERREE